MKPILFNTDMVRAILEDRKTVTRRVVKPQPVMYGFGETHFDWSKVKAPYSPGDILYVRETFGTYNGDYYLYRADYPDGATTYDFDVHRCDLPRWHPSIHMPREAARIFLRVTDVREERLREITEEQARAEGLYKGWSATETSSTAATAKQAFMWVWDSTIKPADRALYGWLASPWVWVIEFERCEKPESD